MEKMKLKLKKKIFQTPLFFVNFLFFFFLLILTQLNGNEIFEETTVDQFSSISEAELLNQTFYWGTYRPNLYFGIKNRAEKEEILTGLMWHSVSNLDASIEGQNRMMQTHYEKMRHSCEESDNFQNYGWKKHDGKYFGTQEILDSSSNFNLTTVFMKPQPNSGESDWIVRIIGSKISSSLTKQLISIYYYVSIDATFYPSADHSISLKGKHPKKGLISNPIVLEGSSSDLGYFSVVVKEDENNKHPEYEVDTLFKGLPHLEKTHYAVTYVPGGDVWKAKELTLGYVRAQHQTLFNQAMKTQQNLAKKSNNPIIVPILIPTLPNTVDKKANIAILQKIVELPFEIEVSFQTNGKKKKPPIETPKTVLLQKIKLLESDFDDRFSHTFHLEEKRFSLAQRNFAKYAFSNLIGGIGFFRGRSIIQRSQSKQPEYSSVKSLFSAVPSRPFFPRGFLWDEGFHQLLVSKWDFEITLEVLKSWFSVMEPDGWIPREQILGEEARSKVPAEFQTQYDIYANPPTLFLPIHSLYQKFRSSPSYSHNLEKLKTFLQGIFPKIETNFKWFQRTQHGVYPNSFRWRGRTENHTLTSGLDDYPRVPKPSTNELHLDLLCWMIKTCKILSELSEFIGENEKSLSYKKIYQDLLSQLDVVYWDEESKMYADVVLSSSNSLENRTFIQHHGYISLFPLLFGLIPHTSSKLEHIFKILKDPNHLWSPYGIRSLSKSDPYFGTGENYWKGPIWINMNFLLLSSLHANYINTEGPYKEQASQIYSELRSNLITNMFENYERTGFIWEQYNPINGQGQRSHPFTGWSSLIVLIMAELY